MSVPNPENCTWWVEFTDSQGTKTSEPSRCCPACQYPDTEAGAQRFADEARQPSDLAPPRVYRKDSHA